MLEEHFTSFRATVLAYPSVNGTADRYFVKTSIPLKTYLNCEDFRRLTKTIWSISPGYDCMELTGCNFGVKWLFGTLFNWRHLRHFLLKLMKCSVKPG